MLINLPSLNFGALARPSTPQSATNEKTWPNSLLFHCFHFIFIFESIKELGARHHWNIHLCFEFEFFNFMISKLHDNYMARITCWNMIVWFLSLWYRCISIETFVHYFNILNLSMDIIIEFVNYFCLTYMFHQNVKVMKKSWIMSNMLQYVNIVSQYDIQRCSSNICSKYVTMLQSRRKNR
jgi:hypothetical protein